MSMNTIRMILLNTRYNGHLCDMAGDRRGVSEGCGGLDGGRVPGPQQAAL